ncbi:hypothetical protein CVT24_000600 [Panaeolus cyanescens]|uniref:F-box domain-containing protein n=1 Tax=Panaeolus cyanescens TaxID=181874 RepID=A0A409YDJ0_9AGAR|nr:hypothetical protein CVT24_000600 [Panaeolus cyanescens]
MSDDNRATSKDTNDTEGPVFPFDIFEIIINNLITVPSPSHSRSGFPKPDRDILSLSLVSKSFAEICQPLLFKSVRLDIHSHLDRAQQFVGAIKSNPTLARYTKRLEYQEPNKEPVEPISAERDGSFTPLLQLPRLQYLRVIAKGREGKSYDCPESSTGQFGFRSLLDQYIASSTLTGLYIQSIKDLPILDILSCPNLEDLELLYCGIKGWDHPAPSEVLKKGFKLKTAAIRSASGVNDVAFPLFAYCQQVERLQFARQGGFRSERPEKFQIRAPPLVSFKNLTFIESLASVDWSYFCRLAESAGVKAFPAVKRLKYHIIAEEDITLGINPIFEHMESLEELDIRGINDYGLDPTPLISLKRFFSLSAQTLKDITIKWKACQDHTLIKVLRVALEGISHINVLRRLYVVLVRGSWDMVISPEEWNLLSRLLTADNGAAFPGLEEVIILLQLNKDRDKQDALRDYEKLFKLTMNRIHTFRNVRTSFAISAY